MSLPRKRAGRQGMAALELLVALPVAALVVTAGLAACGGLLQRLAGEALRQSEAVAVRALEDRLTLAWRARRAHALQDGSWLVIDGSPQAEGLQLRRLWLRTHTPGGAAGFWELALLDGRWLVRSGLEGAPAGQVETVAAGYAGAILADLPAGGWPAGGAPPRLSLRFPDARRADLRQGFAIRALW